MRKSRTCSKIIQGKKRCNELATHYLYEKPRFNKKQGSIYRCDEHSLFQYQTEPYTEILIARINWDEFYREFDGLDIVPSVWNIKQIAL